MKKIAFIALVSALLLIPLSLALAAPIDPLNSRPVTVGISPSSEESLQSILATKAFPGAGLDALSSQMPDGMWQHTAAGGFFPTTAPALLVEYAGLANYNFFGIWSGSDTSAVTQVEILNGQATPGTAALLAWLDNDTVQIMGGPNVNVGIFDGIDVFGFGFYMRSDYQGDRNTSNDRYFYSADALNPNGEAHVLAYNKPNTDSWALAFEDLPFSASDRDYNDMVVRVESITRVPVPEPGTLLLLGTGLIGIGGLGLYRRRR